MKWLIAAVAAFFAVVVLLETGFAIQCYECNSFHAQDCADWFNNNTHNLVDCPENVTMCRKIVQEVYYEGDWNTRYIRQCAPHGVVGDDQGRKCVDRTGTYRVKMRYCHCDFEDGCNGAKNVAFSLSLLVVPSILTLAIRIL
ncbi:hypothetical protein ScPMuIL_004424 [Solemya velum]